MPWQGWQQRNCIWETERNEFTCCYLKGVGEGTTTTLLEHLKSGDDTLSYTYDALGNISTIAENGIIKTGYTYGALSQLIREGITAWKIRLIPMMQAET